MKNKERQRIINNAAKIVHEITQLFNDFDHWNGCKNRTSQEVINIDPDGKLLKIKNGLEAMLEREAKLGNFPS